MRRTRRSEGDATILRAAAPAGPGWVHATVGRLTYGRWRLGFVKYDLALSAEDQVLIVYTGWRFVGLRGRLPPWSR
jgi:hypothetical protein